MDAFVGGGNDFLSEYRAISNKLKKRFLRRPNVAEAGEQFAKLAKKLKLSEEPQYEAMCHLAAARCEQNAGNITGEAEALIAASRSFMTAEKAIVDANCPSLEEHFSSAIQSYNHAIRLLKESDNPMMAFGLCMELANTLVELDKPGEARTYYQRAAGLRPQASLDHLRAQEMAARMFINTGDYHNALHLFTNVSNIAEQISGMPPASIYLDILGRCEIFRVLLLLIIQPTPQNVSPSLTSILEKYAWESSSQIIRESGSSADVLPENEKSGQISGSESSENQYLSDEVFLLLQSVVMAVQVCDGNALGELEDYLVPHLRTEPQQRDLLRKLVTLMKDKSDGF